MCQTCKEMQPPEEQTQASGAQKPAGDKKRKEKKKQVNEEADPFDDNHYRDYWHDNYTHADPELYPDVRYDIDGDLNDCGDLTADEDGFVYDPDDYGRFPDNFDDTDVKRAQVKKRRQRKKKAIVRDEVEEPANWKNMQPPGWENPEKIGLRKFVPEWWKPDLRTERTPNEDPEFSRPKGFEWFTPLDLFLLYIPLHLFYTIADMTNLRFKQKAPKDDDPKKAEKENFRKRWYPCSVTMVLRFVGLMVLFTLCKQQRNGLFWSSEGLCTLDVYEVTGLSQHRFKMIKRYLAIVDAEQTHAKRGQDYWDPLFLVRPLYDEFRASLRKHSKPGKHMAIDEFMIACKLRSFLQKLVKGKVS